MNAAFAITRRGYRGTFLWTEWRAWIANMVIRPITYLMVFGILHQELGLDATKGTVVALCAYSTVVTVLTCSNHAVRTDLLEGTFAIAMSTPVSASGLWLSRVAAHLPNAAASAVSGLLFAAIAFDVDLGEVDLATLATFGVVLLSGLSLSMLTGVLTRRLADWVGPVALVSGVLLTMSGAVIPRDRLPGILHDLSAAIPLAHASDALRKSLALQPGSPWGDIAAELVVGVVFGIVALAVFRRSLRRARANGTLTVEGT